jgi:hypothetical protein
VVRLAISQERARARLVLSSKNGSYPLDVADLPLTAVLVIDAPIATSGQCGEGRVEVSSCVHEATRGTLRCRR